MGIGVYDNLFKGIIYKDSPLSKMEYDSCRFQDCNFSESDLSGIVFVDCIFENCDISLANITNTVFSDVEFTGCKMLGLQFNTCIEFGLSFSMKNCQLNNSTFYQTKISGVKFENSQLIEVDFTEGDLTEVLFNNCDLSGAQFEATKLEKADFRTSFNYTINPEMNNIRKAKFAFSGIKGLLQKYDIEIE